MPVLNEEGYLADAVAAVLSQSYPAEAELVIALGASTDRTTEIAHELHVSESTVKTHVSAIMTKLNVTSRLKAVVRAYELGLVSRG